METLNRWVVLATKLAINALALVVVDAIFANVRFDNIQATIAAAILLALINTYLRPILLWLTLPINVLTLGLFTLVINAGLLKLISWLIPAFHLTGFWTALGAALVISIISTLLNWFLLPPANVRVRVWRGSL
ncbi:MAG: phage holin family protein [Verrucomicrobiae bacterium]|nr:phage holin family protein [Verrucomicrobiae bacterium]MDW8344672.1 phage holin family protein [Verrucomicrobiae bacterium]